MSRAAPRSLLFSTDPAKRPSDVEALLKVLMELEDPWRCGTDPNRFRLDSGSPAP